MPLQAVEHILECRAQCALEACLVQEYYQSKTDSYNNPDLNMTDKQRAMVMEAIQQDVAVLQKLDLMDYRYSSFYE